MKKTNWLVIMLGCAFIGISTLPFFLAGANAIFTSFVFGDFLTYYGAVLSAIGTIALGFIAVYQNKKLTTLQEQVQSTTRSCNIYLTTPKAVSDLDSLKVLKNSNAQKNSKAQTNSNAQTNSDQSKASEPRYLALDLENFSDPFLKSIEITFPVGSDTPSTTTHHSFITLVKQRKKNYLLELPEDINKDGLVGIKFTSCYDVVTCGDFRIERFYPKTNTNPCDSRPDHSDRAPDTSGKEDKSNSKIYFKPLHYNFYGTTSPTKPSTPS